LRGETRHSGEVFICLERERKRITYASSSSLISPSATPHPQPQQWFGVKLYSRLFTLRLLFQ
jgi:hypothetical protein